MTEPDRYPERVERIRELVSAGDDAALVDELVDLAAANGDTWRYDGAAVRDRVSGLPPDRRHALIIAVLGRAGPVEVSGLLRWLAVGIPAGSLSWPAARPLVEAAGMAWTYSPDQLRVLIQVAERETGGVPPLLRAVLRRTVHKWPAFAVKLEPWVSDPAAPPLNDGEVWAERANQEAATLGGHWPDLLAHAARATGAKPASGWSQRAVDLADAVGRTAGRERVRDWLDLVPRPRTARLAVVWGGDHNEVIDSYNAVALRGLIFVLTVTPTQPDDVRTLGTLVEHAATKVPGFGPRSLTVASAAVYALGRITTLPALHQLIDLRARVTVPSVRGRLDQAVASRAAALGLTPPARP